MLYVLYTLFFLSCIILVGSVLLQPGKTDAGALFTSNVSSNAFGPRGTATVLGKITIVAAVIFMLSALMISMPAFNGGSSVLNSTTAETPAEAPAETNTNTEANPAANSSDNTNGVLNQAPPSEQVGNETSNSAPSNANTSASASANVANVNAKKAATATPKK